MRFLFILLLITGSLSSSYSQKNDPSGREAFLRFGIKGGLNLNKIDGVSFKNEFRYNYQLGGFLQVNLTRKLGIQPELNFVQSSAEQSDDITVIYDDLFLGGTQKNARLNYLKFAGLVNIDIGPSERVKLQLGPQWGMLVDEAVDNLKSPAEIFKKGEFSVLGGIFLQLPLIHIGTRYEIGLTNINSIDNMDEWRNQAWQFFAGITF